MRILITGGAGFIGGALTAPMVQDGHSVCVLDNHKPKHGIHHACVEPIVGDLRDINTCRKAVNGIDVIFHNAALCSLKDSLKNPQEAYDINVTGTKNLLTAAVQAKVKKVIFSSTAKVYGEPGDYVSCESDLPNPMTPYSKSKYEAEQFCKQISEETGLPIIGLRYFSVYGPGQKLHYGLMGVVMGSLRNDTTRFSIAADRLMLRDFVYIDDVVLANQLCLRYEPDGFEVFNIASGMSYALYEVIQLIHLISGQQIQPQYGKLLEGMILHMRASIVKATEKLAFQPRMTLEEGLLKTINWVRALNQKKEN